MIIMTMVITVTAVATRSTTITTAPITTTITITTTLNATTAAYRYPIITSILISAKQIHYNQIITTLKRL